MERIPVLASDMAAVAEMWKLLMDQKIGKADLRKAAGIALNTMTKLRRDEAVSLAILERICDVPDCDFGGTVYYVKDADTPDSKLEGV